MAMAFVDRVRKRKFGTREYEETPRIVLDVAGIQVSMSIEETEQAIVEMKWALKRAKSEGGR